MDKNSKTAKARPTQEQKEQEAEEARKYIDGLVQRSLKAEAKFATYSQAQVDKIVQAAATAGTEASLRLAHAAVDETQRGVVEDKDTKNRFASENCYHSIKDDKTVGVIGEDPVLGQVKIAAPLGVLAGVTPVTNPTSTTMFKILITLKTRNTIVFGFHPQAQKCSVEAAKILYDAAVKAGAPKDCILWIEHPSLANTTALMRNPHIASILATGGPSMVHAALTSGNPSLGVGPGNGAEFVDHTAKIDRAVEDMLLSKRFDNSMICATENSVVVEESVYDEYMKKMQDHGAYNVPKSDFKKYEDFVFNDKHGVNGPVAGKPAQWIAKHAGASMPKGKDVLLFELDPKNIGEKLSSEKLSPLLSVYKAKDREDGCRIIEKLLQYQGAGHNAAIQIGSMNDPFVKEYAEKVDAARVLVNQPDSIGGIGDVYTDALRSSLTLGTGSWGKNSLSHNLSTQDLLNVKTVAKRRNRPQWIRLPQRIYYEKNAISYLRDSYEEMHRIFIVADPGMVEFGFVKKLEKQLDARKDPVNYRVYGDIKPNPPLSQAMEIAQKISAFKPDTIIAIGGGSALDAAKISRYMYEYSLNQEPGFLEDHDKVSDLFLRLQQKFLDIRKRTVKFQKPKATKLICIPSTSGTGSEVTPYSVITDDKTDVKYPLTDYELTPDVAIVDPEFVLTVPKRTLSWTGLDVLSHAMESYVSVMASEFTRPWSLQAAKLVFKYLKDSYDYDPKHPTEKGEKAREKMHYAATIAGMAFANAFLGMNHSLAHKTGGAFGLPHGLAISIAMTHVVRFNAKTGAVKRNPFPRYEVYRGQHDYATIAKAVGCKGNSDAELVEALCNKIDQLMASVNVVPKLSANGVTKKEFDAALPTMVDNVYNDQCTPVNPRQPSLAEIRQLLIDEF